MSNAHWYGEALDRAESLRHLHRFFVVGCQKSGTTWMQLLCNAHPRMICRGEGHFSDILVPVMTRAFETYNEQGKTNHKLPPEDLLAATRVLIDQMLYRYLPESPAARAQVVAIGDKTPEGAVGIPQLDTLHPGARFVHIIRDGRDCVVSGWAHLRRMGQADRFPSIAEYTRFFIERHWLPYVTVARQTGARLGVRYLELRYEDMLASPHEHAARLFGFLGVPADADTIDQCVERTSFERLSGGRRPGDTDAGSHYRKGVAGDWRSVLDREALEQFEELAGPLARELGYSESRPAAAG